MFKYKVTYWSEYDSDEKLDVGIVVGATYIDAANELLKAFGEDSLIDMYLLPLDVDDCRNVISWDDIKLSFKDE